MLQKLRKMREDKGLTVKDMSNLLNYKSPSTYAKKEREEIPISLYEAQKICIILNTTLDEIFLSENYLNKIQNVQSNIEKR